MKNFKLLLLFMTSSVLMWSTAETHASYTNCSPSGSTYSLACPSDDDPPLLLVDGIEREPEYVNMENIETLTILRDESSTAPYGERGSGGVIFIVSKNPALLPDVGNGENSTGLCLNKLLTPKNEKAPFLLVDGIERDPDFLKMEDIAVLSLHRDSSTTAKYGERACGGVVLVTTKRSLTAPHASSN